CGYVLFGHHLYSGSTQGGEAQTLCHKLLDVRSATTAFAGWISLHLCQLFCCIAMEQRLGDGGRRAHRTQKDDLASELALEFVEVLFVLQIHIECFAPYCSV